MKKLPRPLQATWLSLALFIAAALTSAVVLLTKLTTLVPGLAPLETMTLAGSANHSIIITNPQDLPLKLLQRLATLAPAGHVLLFDRLPSVLLAAFSLVIFSYILRRWYGRRTALFGFSVLVASAWFLHIGRFAGTDIEYFAAILSLIAINIRLYDHADQALSVYAWLVANIVLLFIPGFAWLVALGIVMQWAELQKAWKHMTAWWLRFSWALLGLIGIATSIYAIIKTPMLWRGWLGIPAQLAPWLTLLENIPRALGSFVYQGPHDPQLWLGRLPILDALLSFMLVVGTIFYVQHWRATRTRLLFGYLILGSLLVALNGPVRLSVIIPIVYLIAVAGIAYSLHFWLRVFPHNPLMRTVGFVIIASVIGLSCWYNLEQYFVAWPQNPETRTVYVQGNSLSN